RRLVHLFMNGGPSHVDTFDPKPKLAEYHGKPLSVPNLRTERKTAGALRSPFAFKRHGQSGLEVSELFERTAAAHADDLCVIRSMHADVPNHEPSLMLMNCGDGRLPRPSMGAWLTYGLGSVNQNLPGFIAMCPGGLPIVGPQNWRAAFLPRACQGTYLHTHQADAAPPIQHPPPPSSRPCTARCRPTSSGASSTSSAASTRHTRRSAAPPRCWRPASPRWSWPTACRPRPPTPSTSTASRWPCASATAPASSA